MSWLELIILGIRQSQKHLRILAMLLIGIPLIKVAIVDLADLGTLNKTLVLIVMGTLLLFILFVWVPDVRLVSGLEKSLKPPLFEESEPTECFNTMVSRHGLIMENLFVYQIKSFFFGRSCYDQLSSK